MKVAFNPAVSFRNNENIIAETKTENSKVSVPKTNQDAFVSKESTEKPGNAFTRGIASIWKFFSVSGTMISSTFKGVLYGLTVGALVVLGAATLRLPKVVRSGVKLSQALKNPLKTAGKSGKIVAAASGAIVLASNIIKGRLQANEDITVIDRKLKLTKQN